MLQYATLYWYQPDAPELVKRNVTQNHPPVFTDVTPNLSFAYPTPPLNPTTPYERYAFGELEGATWSAYWSVPELETQRCLYRLSTGWLVWHCESGSA